MFTWTAFGRSGSVFLTTHANRIPTLPETSAFPRQMRRPSLGAAGQETGTLTCCVSAARILKLLVEGSSLAQSAAAPTKLYAGSARRILALVSARATGQNPNVRPRESGLGRRATWWRAAMFLAAKVSSGHALLGAREDAVCVQLEGDPSGRTPRLGCSTATTCLSCVVPLLITRPGLQHDLGPCISQRSGDTAQSGRDRPAGPNRCWLWGKA